MASHETDPDASRSNTESVQQASPSNNGRRPFYRNPPQITALVTVLLVLVLAGGGYWYYSQQFVSTDDAFLKGQPVQIAPQVAAPVTEVRVEENENVDQGQILAVLEPADFQVALQQAQARRDGADARLTRARAQLGTVRAEVEAAEAQRDVARTRVRNAAADLARLRNIDPQYVEQRQLDDAADRLDEARAKRRAADKQVAAKRARVDSARASIADAQAAIDEARASVRQAELKQSYTTITAPTDGQVASVGVEAGEFVAAGQAMMTVVPDSIRVQANFKETQITHMQPGQPVDIEIDAYPGRTFEGHVVAIQRATGSQFSLLPPQNASGNFVKVVQRVPVRIAFDERPDVHTLAPGLSVVPTVRVLSQPPWPWSTPTVESGQQPPR